MFFASPIWLLGLIPWAAWAAWLLWGRRREAGVPFLDLWRGPVAGSRSRRKFRAPPLALASLIGATFFSILAAAGPVLSAIPSPVPITIVVDHDLTMSARGRLDLRFRETLWRARAPLIKAFWNQKVEFSSVPGGLLQSSDIRDWTSPAASLPPTAVTAGAELESAVTRQLSQTEGPVVLISDKRLSVQNERLVQIPPAGTARNVGTVHVAAREHPRPQVMVRLRNQSPQQNAAIEVASADYSAATKVELPAEGERDYFIDAPAFGPVLAVHVTVTDDLAVDNHAWLVRERSWPRLETRAPMPPALQRMIEVYEKSRPADDGSARLAIVSEASQIPGDQPAVVLAGASTETRAAEGLKIVDHPVTRAVEWDKVLSGPLRLAPQPPGGWTPLVTLAGRTLIAARVEPSRRIWVGFDATDWPTSPDYVIFWTNVFDWAGEGGEPFAAHPVAPLEGDWQAVESVGRPAKAPNGLWPGLYRRADGVLQAVNCLDVRIEPPPHTEWPAHLARLSAQQTGGQRLRGGVLLAALFCLLIAACAWPKNRLTVFSAGPTV